jgi:hypothetical protein
MPGALQMSAVGSKTDMLFCGRHATGAFAYYCCGAATSGRDYG